MNKPADKSIIELVGDINKLPKLHDDLENESWRNVGGSREKNSHTGEVRPYTPDKLEDCQRDLPPSNGAL